MKPVRLLLGCWIALAMAAVLSCDLTPGPVRAASSAGRSGAEVFATHGCVFCHGPQLAGTERAPNLQQVRKRLKADQIAHQIREGGKGMPAFGEQLTPEQIDDLVAFLRDRHPEKLLPAPAPPPSAAPQP